MDQTQQHSKTTIADSQAASASVRDRLMDELHHTISEAEKWLADSADHPGTASGDTRARFDDTLRTARNDLRKLEDSIIAHSHEAADTINAYVRDHPWKAVGLGAALGVVIGVLVSRK